jgi:hypothetical protein
MGGPTLLGGLLRGARSCYRIVVVRYHAKLEGRLGRHNYRVAHSMSGLCYCIVGV